jgi:hypothetical protein
MVHGRARVLSAFPAPICGCVLVVLSACGGGGEEMLQRAEPVGGRLVVSVTADAQRYSGDDAIGLTLGVRNNSDSSVVLQFATGQRYDFTILTAEGDTAWSWSADRNFTQVLGQETVQPGQGLLFRRQVQPGLKSGTFRLVGRITASNLALADTTVIVVQ